MSTQVSLFSYFGSMRLHTPFVNSALRPTRILTKKDHISIKNVVKNLVDNVVKHETKKRDDMFDLTSRKLENWKKTYKAVGHDSTFWICVQKTPKLPLQTQSTWPFNNYITVILAFFERRSIVYNNRLTRSPRGGGGGALLNPMLRLSLV